MRTFFSNVQEAVRLAPLWVLALAIYAALPSSVVFSDAVRAQLTVGTWQPSFVNVGDLILLAGIIFSWIILRLTIDRGILIFFAYILGAIAVSIVFSSITFNFNSLGDAMIDLLRFALVFCFAAAFTKRYGVQISSIYLLIPFTLLAGAALWVLYTTVNPIERLSAPAMTIGSFAQLCALAVIVTAEAKYWPLLAFAVYMLSLTASAIPSFILFVGIVIWLLSSRPWPVRVRVLAVIIGLAFATLWVMQGLGNGQLERTYDSILTFIAANPRVATIDTRTQIWALAWSLLGSGVVSAVGIGFNQGPYYLNKISIAVLGSNETIIARQFHSIIFEYVIGFGVLAVPILFMMVKRLWQTWRAGVYFAFLIFIFFVPVQSVDFSLFRPKELVIWALALGIAEGQWRARQVAVAAAADAVAAPAVSAPVRARVRPVPALATAALSSGRKARD